MWKPQWRRHGLPAIHQTPGRVPRGHQGECKTVLIKVLALLIHALRGPAAPRLCRCQGHQVSSLQFADSHLIGGCRLSGWQVDAPLFAAHIKHSEHVLLLRRIFAPIKLEPVPAKAPVPVPAKHGSRAGHQHIMYWLIARMHDFNLVKDC
eukprot:scaffold6018_cov21-Tisochrysis_lutea.AAC.1